MNDNEIDNFDLIKHEVIEPELRLGNPGAYWVVQLILRSKDFPDREKVTFAPFKNKGHEYFVRQWLINSSEELERHRESMIAWAKMTGGRLYFNIDAKDMRKTLANQVVNSTNMLANFNSDNVKTFVNNFYSVPRLADNSISKSRYVLLDVDFKNPDVDDNFKAYALSSLIGALSASGIPSVWTTVKTVSGYHVFTKIRGEKNANVDTLKLGKVLEEFRNEWTAVEVDEKYNSSTILYYKR